MESLFSATDLCLLLNLHPLNLSIGVLRYKFKYLYFDLVLKYLKLLEMLKKKKDVSSIVIEMQAIFSFITYGITVNQ